MKKRLISLLSVAILLASSVLIGCKNETSGGSKPDLYETKAAPTGYVMGYVVDNRGEPVSGATVTLGNKTATTNGGGQFKITGVDPNDLKKLGKYYVATGDSQGPASTADTNFDTNLKTGSTAYSVTVTKKGYLSATVPAIYVAYQETETGAAKAYQEMITQLEGDFSTMLDDYVKQDAVTGTNTTTTTGSSSTTTTTTATNGDSVINNTVTTSSNADEVMKIIAKAMAALSEDSANYAAYTEFFSTFAKAVMIPCDASFSGKIELQLKTKDATTYDATTYAPASGKAIVRASYKPAIPAGSTTGYIGAGNTAISNTTVSAYTWEAKVGKDGKFPFEGLPSGVSVKFSVDTFFETINTKEYVFSSESAEMKITNNKTIPTATPNNPADLTDVLANGVTLEGADNGKSCVFILYAQNDKIWVTETNVDSYSEGKLLTTKDALEFTFNKPMLKLSVSDSADTNATDNTIALGKGDYTIDWNEDFTKATIKPVLGYWTVKGAPTIKLAGEATDGTKVFLNGKDSFKLYFDTKVWVSLADDLTLKDYNDRVALNKPIVIEFSKAMNKEIALTLTGTDTAYDETWDSTKTKLTLTPVLDYWKVTGTDGKVTVKVNDNGGTSEEYFNDSFGYWKRGSGDSGLDIYFDYYVDVTVEDASTTAAEAIKLTFSKKLKSFDKVLNSLTVKENKNATTAYNDYTVEIDSTGKIITITSINPVFKEPGKYYISLANLEAEDGSKYFREFGDKDVATGYSSGNFSATTDFTFDGFILKVVNIDVLDKLPATAVASRSIVSVTPSDVLKITFNKPIYKSELTVTVGTAPNASVSSPKNYIDSVDSTIVYVPLSDVTKVNDKIVLGNFASVKATDGTDGNDSTATTNWTEWSNDTEYRIYSAITLIDTNLVKKENTASDIPYYVDESVIDASAPITFTFSAVPDKVHYTLYRFDGTGNIAVKVDEGEATLSGAKATVNAANLIPVADKADGAADRYTEYFIDINAVNADGITLFSTTNAWTLDAPADTFENDVSWLFDDGDTSAATPTTESNLDFGTIKFFVKPLTLTGTNLYDEDEDDIAKLDAKTNIEFTFDSAIPAGYKAEYVITDSTDTVIDNAAATISGNKVTIPGAALIIDSATADSTTGITKYWIDFAIFDSNADDAAIVFSTSDNFPLTDVDTFEGDVVTNTLLSPIAGNATNAKAFEVDVKPITIIAADALVKRTLSFNEVTEDGYEVQDNILPGAEVTLKFSNKIPAGSKIKWAVYDGADDLIGDENNVAVTTATDTFKFASPVMLAATDAPTKYNVWISIEDADGNILFSTENAYFGASNETADFENALNENGFVVKRGTTPSVPKYLGVTVVQTQAIKDESTSIDDPLATYKSDIVLKLTHPIPGYKAILYSTSKLINRPGSTLTAVPALDDGSTGNEPTKFADWKEEAKEYIYASDNGSVTADTITIKPADYFTPRTTVKVALFDADGNFVDVKFDDGDPTALTPVPPRDLSFTADTDTDAYFAEIIADGATEDLTIVTEDEEIGDGRRVAFSVPTKLSEVTDKMPEYALFIKNAEDLTYSPVTNVTGYDDPDGNPGSGDEVLIGMDTYDTDTKSVSGDYVSRINKILGRADTAYFDFALALNAFGVRPNGKVSLVFLEYFDGKITTYTAELTDKSGPENIAIVANSLAGNGVDLVAPADGDGKVYGVTSSAIFVDGVADPDADPTPTDVGNFNFAITVGGGQIIKSAIVTWKTHKSGTGTSAETSSGSFVTLYDATSTTATIYFKNPKLFAGDEINIKVTDTSGNIKDYVLTVQ